jgi:hypothetical protein
MQTLNAPNSRDSIRPGFPGTIGAVSWCSIKFGLGREMSQVFPSLKNTTFLTMCMNILIFLQWE